MEEQALQTLRYGRMPQANELHASGKQQEHVGESLPVHEAIAYLENHGERMGDAHARQRGLPIGSGTVEAPCKSFVALRMKRPGTRWKHPSGQQANTSRANVLRSGPAQSHQGVRSFFGSSTFAAKDGLSSSGSGFAPAWGSRRSRAPRWESGPRMSRCAAPGAPARVCATDALRRGSLVPVPAIVNTLPCRSAYLPGVPNLAGIAITVRPDGRGFAVAHRGRSIGNVDEVTAVRCPGAVPSRREREPRSPVTLRFTAALYAHWRERARVRGAVP